MSAKLDSLCQKLTEFIGERAAAPVQQLGEISLEVRAENYLEVAGLLRDHADLQFEQLIDLSGIDYSTFTGWQGTVTAIFGGAIVGTLWFVVALLWQPERVGLQVPK